LPALEGMRGSRTGESDGLNTVVVLREIMPLNVDCVTPTCGHPLELHDVAVLPEDILLVCKVCFTNGVEKVNCAKR
jgi:hypothetical protein